MIEDAAGNRWSLSLAPSPGDEAEDLSLGMSGPLKIVVDIEGLDSVRRCLAVVNDVEDKGVTSRVFATVDDVPAKITLTGDRYTLALVVEDFRYEFDAPTLAMGVESLWEELLILERGQRPTIGFEALPINTAEHIRLQRLIRAALAQWAQAPPDIHSQ